MFERYDEGARRSIFFARYEASQFGSPYIEAPHLLLGLLRENAALRERFGEGTQAAIRKWVEENAPRRQRISTSVDLPLDDVSKRALSYAVEEADKLGSEFIDSGHLLLGLLRTGGPVAEMLAVHGVTLDSCRSGDDAFGDEGGGGDAEWYDLSEAEPLAPELAPVVDALRLVTEAAVKHFERRARYGAQRLKRLPWTRKEALGHLIDLATAHRLWIARAMVEPKVTAAGYPDVAWVKAQKYDLLPWEWLMDHWFSLNRLIEHSLIVMPAERVNTPVRIGLDEAAPLIEILKRYAARMDDWVGQMAARL